MAFTNLVFLCYGSEKEYRRTIFSLSTFLTYHAPLIKIRVNIYTDSPGSFERYFEHLDIQFHMLTPETMLEMLGGSDYIHRRKIAVIYKTFKRYPEDNILFVDSDTFFVAHSGELISSITPAQCYMHIREYTFQQGLDLFASFNQAKEPADFIKFIESGPLMIAGNTEQILRNHYCWNSGVLGLDKTISNSIPDVFNLSDSFYKYSKWFISEQLAFSIVLDKVSTIYPADQYVVHYWGKRQKALMDALLIKHNDWLIYSDLKADKLKSQIKRLKRTIANDILKEKAVIALSNKSYRYGIKRAIYAILKDPTNVSLFKELWVAQSNQTT